MKIVASDRPGLATDITNIIDRNSINMRYFKGYTPPFMKSAYFDIRFFAKDPKEIGRIFYEIRQISAIKTVNRVKPTQLILFILSLIFTIFVWVSNSFLINYIIDIGFKRVNSILAYTLLYIELFMPLVSVIFLTNVLGKYYPALINKRIIWLLSFIALSFSVLFIFQKYINLNFEINSKFMATGVIIAYLYLFLRYRKIMKD
jgi:hypothetical protein